MSRADAGRDARHAAAERHDTGEDGSLGGDEALRAQTVPTAGGTLIQRCVRTELLRYFELLDGEPPNDLYRMVMQQVERALLDTVLHECDGNRSRAAAWLGISRGTLRGKLSDIDRDRSSP